MVYDALADTTTLSGSFGTAIFGLGVSMHVGDAVVPNLHQPAALHIISGAINTPPVDDTMQVKGDVTAFVAIGDQFRIHQAAGYDYNFDTVGMQDACDYGGRNLWSGYKRHIGSGSRAGEEPYTCWNRWYLPSIGRWTSPDPAEQFFNLFVHTTNPLTLRDPSGLDYSQIEELFDEGCLNDDQKKFVKALSDAGWTFIDGDVDVDTDDGLDNRDSEGIAAVDNQYRIDAAKKEIELDYSHDVTGCTQLKIALRTLLRWRDSGDLHKNSKKKDGVNVGAKTYKCVVDYENDLATFDLSDFDEDCLKRVMLGLSDVAMAGLGIYAHTLYGLCVGGLSSPPTSSLKSGLAACAGFFAFVYGTANAVPDIRKALDACRKDD